jgi:hypothetical protein
MGDGIDALRIANEEVPSIPAGGDDGLVAVPDKPAEFVAADIYPDSAAIRKNRLPTAVDAILLDP